MDLKGSGNAAGVVPEVTYLTMEDDADLQVVVIEGGGQQKERMGRRPTCSEVGSDDMDISSPESSGEDSFSPSSTAEESGSPPTIDPQLLHTFPSVPVIDHGIAAPGSGGWESTHSQSVPSNAALPSNGSALQPEPLAPAPATYWVAPDGYFDTAFVDQGLFAGAAPAPVQAQAATNVVAQDDDFGPAAVAQGNISRLVPPQPGDAATNMMAEQGVFAGAANTHRQPEVVANPLPSPPPHAEPQAGGPIRRDTRGGREGKSKPHVIDGTPSSMARTEEITDRAYAERQRILEASKRWFDEQNARLDLQQQQYGLLGARKGAHYQHGAQNMQQGAEYTQQVGGTGQPRIAPGQQKQGLSGSGLGPQPMQTSTGGVMSAETASAGSGSVSGSRPDARRFRGETTAEKARRMALQQLPQLPPRPPVAGLAFRPGLSRERLPVRPPLPQGRGPTRPFSGRPSAPSLGASLRPPPPPPSSVLSSVPSLGRSVAPASGQGARQPAVPEMEDEEMWRTAEEMSDLIDRQGMAGAQMRNYIEWRQARDPRLRARIFMDILAAVRGARLNQARGGR
ncbi:hypothetical protein B0H63DRAFT_510678 [Podospora didyma]|uniref:Uncharacterized protein n=1 Tax=Podospora didyma TaxID=330526 RepID=A0AAE0NQV9_9PEZI|nr:hypothetical protein B0H63DRAFT_510678 [Podospora didyma]